MSEAGGQRRAGRETLRQLREERSSQVKAANAANAVIRSERKKIVKPSLDYLIDGIRKADERQMKAEIERSPIRKKNWVKKLKQREKEIAEWEVLLGFSESEQKPKKKKKWLFW